MWGEPLAWAGSGLLFACKHSVTRKCGVSSAPVPLNFLHPMHWVFLFCCPSCSCFSQDGRARPCCNLCFLQGSLVACLTSAALPRFFISQAFQTLPEHLAVAARAAAASDKGIYGGGDRALTRESDLGSDSASVIALVGKLLAPSESLGFLSCKEKIMSVCCKDEIK